MATLTRALAVVFLTGAGCASFARLDSPRTVPKGKTELMVAPTVYLGRHDNTAINTDVLFRGGVSDRTDLGLRANLLGFAGDVKVQLVRAPDPSHGVELALAPSVGWGYDISWSSSSGSNNDPSGIWQASLPLLIGVNVGANELVLTPQLLYQHTQVLPAGILNAGATIAFGRMSGSGFSFYPVVAVWKALDARHPFASLGGPGVPSVQPALVFRWGH
jgi:hypothetical protein